MSVNRENIVWQSPDGTWNRGFWTFEYVGSVDNDDFDYEWDVEYSSDEFEHFRGGFATDRQAANWQPGANPGHVSYATDEMIEHLERVKLRFTDPAKAAELDRADRQEKAAALIEAARVKAGDEVRVVVGSLVYGGRLVTNDSRETVLPLPDRGPTMPKRSDLVILRANGTPNTESELTSISKQSVRDRFSRW